MNYRRHYHRGLLAVLTALAGACGDSSPTAPTQAAPTALAIAVPADWLFSTGSVMLSATASYPNGSSRTVTPQWVVDNPAVAGVEPSGRVRGIGPGVATILASLDGAHGTTTLRVIADYRGAWSGQAAIVQCRAPDVRICARSYPMGSLSPIRIVIQQTRDVVSASYESGTSRADLTGAVSGDGVLSLSGRFPPPSIAEIFGWRARISSSGTMAGEYTSVTPLEFFPLVLVEELRDLTRTSPGASQ